MSKHSDFNVGFGAFTAVTTKNVVFWRVAPCGFIINRRFGGTCRQLLQDRRKFITAVISVF
jgi:hypothetical protein